MLFLTLCKDTLMHACMKVICKNKYMSVTRFINMDEVIFINCPVHHEYLNIQSATTCSFYSTFCSLTHHINTLCIQQQ